MWSSLISYRSPLIGRKTDVFIISHSDYGIEVHYADVDFPKDTGHEGIYGQSFANNVYDLS